MMDFYSMEKIAFAKCAEDRETAAWVHLADKANAVRLAGRKSGASLLAGLLNRFVHPFGHSTALIPTAQGPR